MALRPAVGKCPSLRPLRVSSLGAFCMNMLLEARGGRSQGSHPVYAARTRLPPRVCYQHKATTPYMLPARARGVQSEVYIAPPSSNVRGKRDNFELRFREES